MTEENPKDERFYITIAVSASNPRASTIIETTSATNNPQRDYHALSGRYAIVKSRITDRSQILQDQNKLRQELIRLYGIERMRGDTILSKRTEATQKNDN